MPTLPVVVLRWFQISLGVGVISNKPHLSPILALVTGRVIVMSTQSAHVERVCKAHKVVHTKVRIRLKNKTVYMLLRCYANLRLINKLGADDYSSGFLQQAICDNSLEE